MCMQCISITLWKSDRMYLVEIQEFNANTDKERIEAFPVFPAQNQLCNKMRFFKSKFQKECYEKKWYQNPQKLK